MSLGSLLNAPSMVKHAAVPVAVHALLSLPVGSTYNVTVA
jgi:hypothetical protein